MPSPQSSFFLEPATANSGPAASLPATRGTHSLSLSARAAFKHVAQHRFDFPRPHRASEPVAGCRVNIHRGSTRSVFFIAVAVFVCARRNSSRTREKEKGPRPPSVGIDRAQARLLRLCQFPNEAELIDGTRRPAPWTCTPGPLALHPFLIIPKKSSGAFPGCSGPFSLPLLIAPSPPVVHFCPPFQEIQATHAAGYLD